MRELETGLPDACAVARAELGALLDDELDRAARESVERHLAGCAACRAEVALLRAVSHAVGALPLPAPPESIRYRLQAAVAADPATSRFEFRRTEHREGGWVRQHVTLVSPGRATIPETPVARPAIVRLVERYCREQSWDGASFRRESWRQERSVER